jgi:acetyltransferase-like isoleucine patch superfamily enzyme
LSAVLLERACRLLDGLNAAVLKGVTRRGVIVGALSVVTKDVPEFTCVAGNTACKVGEASP